MKRALALAKALFQHTSLYIQPLISYNLFMDYVNFLNLEQLYYWVYLIVKNIFGFLNPANLIKFYYEIWPELMLFSLFLSALCLWALFYIYTKMKDVAVKNSEIFDTVVSGDSFELGINKNERWEKILNYINSDSPAEWKMAILDADVILEEIIIRIGYPGVSLGERLRQIERSDLLSLDSAWEAHKIRNQVAHEGSDIALSHRMAKKAINLYKQVFEELEFI